MNRSAAPSKQEEARKSLSILNAFLSPLSLQEFKQAWTSQRPLFVKGTRDKFNELFERRFGEAWTRWILAQAATREQELLARDPMGPPFIARAVFDREEAFLLPDNPTLPEAAIRPGQYRTFYAAGASIPVNRIRHLDAHVDRVLRGIELQLGLPGPLGTVSYYSPPGTGVSPHFDPNCAFILQLSGTKTYRVAPRPAVLGARGKGYICKDGSVQYSRGTGLTPNGDIDWELPTVDASDMLEFEAEPGDMLYIPGGTVHATKTSGDHSIGLTLIFPLASFRALFDRVLERVLGDRPEWRYLPLWTGADATGGVPQSMADFFAARLGEIREVLSRLQPDGLELNAAWCERIWEASDPQPPPADASIQPADVLEVVHDVEFGYAIGRDVHGKMGMHIYLGNDDMEIEEAWVPFFRKLVAQDRFTAKDATSWSDATPYAWSTVSQYLGQLTARGLLRAV
ncbi:cupin domain-containing protein [Sorangium sp. So ce726]|uniref:JmjC domain-containing protein n=1 Tax=Sorangium sp. So ce726 TaxID=3133319 RepID=UPI003F601BBF